MRNKPTRTPHVRYHTTVPQVVIIAVGTSDPLQGVLGVSSSLRSQRRALMKIQKNRKNQVSEFARSDGTRRVLRKRTSNSNSTRKTAPKHHLNWVFNDISKIRFHTHTNVFALSASGVFAFLLVHDRVLARACRHVSWVTQHPSQNHRPHRVPAPLHAVLPVVKVGSRHVL